jgi:hypothetical protein
MFTTFMVEVKIEKLLQRVKEECASTILHSIKLGKFNWIAHVLRRNCFLIHVLEGKVEEMGRREGRRKQLLDDVKERRYCELKEKALDCTVFIFNYLE